MTLFDTIRRDECLRRAIWGLNSLNRRPTRGLSQPLRTPAEAIADIRGYEAAHCLAPRDLAPLIRLAAHIEKPRLVE